jgi:hypothetical protein
MSVNEPSTFRLTVHSNKNRSKNRERLVPFKMPGAHRQSKGFHPFMPDGFARHLTPLTHREKGRLTCFEEKSTADQKNFQSGDTARAVLSQVRDKAFNRRQMRGAFSYR